MRSVVRWWCFPRLERIVSRRYAISVLALWSPVDVTLGIIGPLGAATAAGTALVIDLDVHGPPFGGAFSLADLVADGPTRAQLEPSKQGPAVLRNGGIDAEQAAEVVSALIERWPNIVLRCPPSTGASSQAIALLPLLPEPFTPKVEGRVVYQDTRLPRPRSPLGPVLPVPRAGTVRALLAGSRPSPGDRWVRAFRQVWEM